MRRHSLGAAAFLAAGCCVAALTAALPARADVPNGQLASLSEGARDDAASRYRSFGGGRETLVQSVAEHRPDEVPEAYTVCGSPCGWESLGLTVEGITAGIAEMYGSQPSNRNLAYIGPYSNSSNPRLLDAFSSWTERYTPEPDYSVRLNSGNGWHMLVRDQSVPGLVTTFDPRGLDQLPTEGATIIGSLYSGHSAQDAVLLAVANGQNLALLGPAALAQAGILPLHVFVQWDAGVRDLDLHATGPLGAGRFHVYFASPGGLGLQPNTRLHADCICEGGSEVITVNGFNPGGVYRFSVFNFGNQSQTSTQLSDSALTLTVYSGGTVVDRPAVDGSRGSAVTGGNVVLQPIAPPRGVAGNTWQAVEIDPNTGAILSVNQIVNSANSAAVR